MNFSEVRFCRGGDISPRQGNPDVASRYSELTSHAIDR